MSSLRTISRRISATQPARLLPSRTSPSLSLSSRSFSVSASKMGRFDGIEPSAPTVKTEIPGPKSKEQIADLDKVFDTRSLNMLTDYKASVGNYIADPDGNKLLDVYVAPPPPMPASTSTPTPTSVFHSSLSHAKTAITVELTSCYHAVCIATPRSPPSRWATTTPT